MTEGQGADMRTKNLFAFLPAAAALLLPCAAHAQCADFYCESFGTYDPGSNTVSGYSLYSDYGEGWTLYVSSYISDPTGNNTWIGESTGFDYVELDFSYNAVGPGGYNITAYNYYNVEEAWAYDGESDYGVDDNGPPEPPPATLTSCSPPTWIVGNNSFTCSGSGFASYTAYVESWGDDGNSFLSSSSVTVNSDSLLTVSVTLNDILYAVAYIEVVVAAAEAIMTVPEMGSAATLQITRTADGANITGTTQNVVESQRVDITAVVTNANGVAPTFSWTIQAPWNAAFDWNDTAGTSTAALSPIPPSQLSSDNLYFAWIATGSGFPIGVTATLPDGTKLTAQVTYNVTLPQVTVGAVQEQSPAISPSCPGYGGDTAMCLYVPPPSGTPGIAFEATSGCFESNVNCEWEQVIDNASYVMIPISGQACAISEQSALDGGGPIGGGGASGNDSPGSALDSGAREQTDIAAFSTFLMYRVNSSRYGTDGVWVPLWRVDWQWSGDAYLSAPGTWSLRSGNPTATIQAQATSSYPAWTSVFSPDAPPPCAGLPIVSGVTVSPSQVASGGNASITVTLSQPAPAGGSTVNLSASSAAFSPQAATCDVPAGATTCTCPGTGGAVTGSTQVSVTATYYNSTQAATVTVAPQQ
jgi:hypothetical protein